MSDDRETFAPNALFDLLSDARLELIAANREHHQAQAAFDAALDAYIETRDRWRRAIENLDRLECFSFDPETGLMVKR